MTKQSEKQKYSRAIKLYLNSYATKCERILQHHDYHLRTWQKRWVGAALMYRKTYLSG